MRNHCQRWVCMLLMSAMGSWLLGGSCLANVQNELDLLWSPEANLDYAHQSWLVKTFGPGVLDFW